MGGTETKYDLSKYDPVPVPDEFALDRPATILYNLALVDELAGWDAVFKARTLDFVGVYPAADEMLDEIQVPVPHGDLRIRAAGDHAEGLIELATFCALAVRHAVERRNLANAHDREALEATGR